ncbi:hypothetical protein K4K57_004737 [Colletotrichum sp. SAR 10_99]|nr:hypothetical protein K4K55_004387 [Colletotrichum sp. SAR 10_96]KAJ5012076.1 hypothetical protein K4K57_004737 [Colletotrichum sp. SAR 10_99]
MDKNAQIVIIGAGLFGLSVARQLALDGCKNIKVLDRRMPPVPDGSSTDISRVVRFDYADEDYHRIAREAYLRWRDDPKYKGIFYQTNYILAGSPKPGDESWMDKTTAQLTKHQLPWSILKDAETARSIYPTLSGTLTGPNFSAYHHNQAGWADASKAITQLRDECLELGISFICGPAGTVVGFDTDAHNTITAVRTLAGTHSSVKGDRFILTAGAWGSGLVPMYNSTLSTAQVLAYLPLTDQEMVKYRDLPIYINYTTGWFNFPPHEDTKTLKMAVHGWGYTRAPGDDNRKLTLNASSPPLVSKERPDFAPADGEDRMRAGLREIVPELADRPFSKVAMCWYTDTPTGDFIMDDHPDYKNLFIGGAGCGHAFKFLPVLGEYVAKASPSTWQRYKLGQARVTDWLKQTASKFTPSPTPPDASEGNGSSAGTRKPKLDAASDKVHWSELEHMAETIANNSKPEEIPWDPILTADKDKTGKLKLSNQQHEHIIKVLEKVLSVLESAVSGVRPKQKEEPRRAGDRLDMKLLDNMFNFLQFQKPGKSTKTPKPKAPEAGEVDPEQSESESDSEEEEEEAPKAKAPGRKPVKKAQKKGKGGKGKKGKKASKPKGGAKKSGRGGDSDCVDRFSVGRDPDDVDNEDLDYYMLIYCFFEDFNTIRNHIAERRADYFYDKSVSLNTLAVITNAAAELFRSMERELLTILRENGLSKLGTYDAMMEMLFFEYGMEHVDYDDKPATKEE